MDLRGFLLENNAYYYYGGLKYFLREDNIVIETYFHKQTGKKSVCVENDARYFLFTSKKLDGIIVSFENTNFVIYSIERIISYERPDYYLAVELLW